MTSVLSLAVNAVVLVLIVWLALAFAAMKWKRTRPVARLYGELITGLVATVVRFLWLQPAPERSGGAELVLPGANPFDEDSDEWDPFSQDEF